jgi:DNA-binding beta-propeller fold protein YncE
MREFPPGVTTAPGRGRARGAWLARVLPVLALMAAPACKLNQQGVSPPLDRIAFPASALVDPDGRWLYVANSNSDLRYNNGTLVAVDLDAAIRDRFGEASGSGPTWPLCAGPDRVRVDSDPDPCCWDRLDHEILNCDERLYIPAASTVEIGSFSSGMVFQPFKGFECAGEPPATPNRHACTTSGTCPGDDVAGRLFIGVRGNSTLTYVDTKRVTDPVLATRPDFSCANPKLAGDSPRVCQVASTVLTTDLAPATTAAPVHVPDEPYALALDEAQDLLYVGNLRGDTAHPQTGGISLFDVARPSGHDAPKFIGPSASLFNPDINGNYGITSLDKRGSALYATSRYGTNAVDVVTSFPPGDLCTDTVLNYAEGFNVSAGGDVFTTPLFGAEIRGIAFMPEGNRAFVLQRSPPALIGFDLSQDPNAFGNFASDVIETCASPTFLQSYDSGEGTRLYVTCFDAGQIYVFDPYVPRLIAVINAGRGPAGIAFPQGPKTGRTERLAYVVGFSANDIPVVDLTPGSETQYHVVQRIGFSSLEPR